MAQCLNPNCLHQNPNINKFCCQCGSSLLLKEFYQPLKMIGQEYLEKSFPVVKNKSKSHRIINYSKLYQFLAVENWKEADLETAKLMIMLPEKQQEEEELSFENIKTYFFLELRKIDRLWLYFSNGHFGFSVQRKIWQQLGGKSGCFESQLYYQWAKQVGWQVNNSWTKYSELNYSANLPDGYFPAVTIALSNGGAAWCGMETVQLFSLVSLLTPDKQGKRILNFAQNMV